MSQFDLDTNREVRKVFVRHWVDLGKLSFRTSNGKVWIRGSLTRIAGMKEQLTGTIVENMFAEIGRVRSVTTVHAEFENWSQAKGKWQSLERSGRQSSSSEERRGDVVQIEDASPPPA